MKSSEVTASFVPGRQTLSPPGSTISAVARVALVTGLLAASCGREPAHQSGVATSAVVAGVPPVGININWPVDWSGEVLFADAVKTSRRWMDADATELDPALGQLDADGWPTVDADIYLWAGAPNNMAGRYALSFTGQAATIAVAEGPATISSVTYSPAANLTTATVVVSGGDSLRLSFFGTVRLPGQPQKGLTNLKLMRPTVPGGTTSYASSTLFTDQELALVAKFQVLRFMDFLGTNDNPTVSWSERTRPGHASQQREFRGYKGDCATGSGLCLYGGALEYAVALCNQAAKDLYVTIPEGANDDYIRKTAQLILYGSDGFNPYTSAHSAPAWAPLATNLNIYVEFSNEVWNSLFGQFTTNHDHALAEASAGGSPLTFDGAIVTVNEWDLAARRSAKRTVDISNIFRGVFGHAAMTGTLNPRVRPVLESQLGFSDFWLMQQSHMLEDYYNNSHYVAAARAPSYYIYGGGGSAYYSPDNNYHPAGGPATQTLSSIWTSLAFSPSNWATPVHKDIDYVLPVIGKRVAYEGGPGLDPCGCATLDSNGEETACECDTTCLAACMQYDGVKKEAWGDARMSEQITSHQAAWDKNGGDLLVYYQEVGGPQWGFTHDNSVLNTAKLIGIDRINTGSFDTSTTSSYGPALPGTIAASAYQSPPEWAGAPDPSNMTANNVGTESGWSWLGYVVHADGPGDGAFSIALTAGSVGTANRAGIYVDGRWIGDIAIPDTGSNSTQVLTPKVSTRALKPGAHGILVKAAAGSFGFASLVTSSVPLNCVEGTITNPRMLSNTELYASSDREGQWARRASGDGQCQMGTFSLPLTLFDTLVFKFQVDTTVSCPAQTPPPGC